MIILLRDCMRVPTEDTPSRLVKADHVEVFHDRIEIHNEVVEHSQIDRIGTCYRYGETYDFCLIYEDADRDILRAEYPNAFEDVPL